MNAVSALAGASVAVVGGGLAGLAATVALTSHGFRVELFESRRYLGGRAASFNDPTTGEAVDHCQHVGMGCCTNLADFCRRTGMADLFRHDETLHFIGPDGRQFEFAAARWLPAPLHLAPAFWGLSYLSVADRLGIARALWTLMRHPLPDTLQQPTVGQWLRSQRQSERAIELFWGVVLVSTLGEQLDRASLSAARKVMVDGFLAARDAYTIQVPRAPLSSLYGGPLESWLANHGVPVHLNTPIRKIAYERGPVVTRGDGEQLRPDFVVLAVPWSKVALLLADEISEQWPWVEQAGRVESAPITSVHLWFDRKVMDLPHAVLVGRLSQWIFQRAASAPVAGETEHYYQLVISASHELGQRDRGEIVAEVCGELAEIWPQAHRACLLRSRVVTQQEAVFSVRPGFDNWRPAQQTSLPGLVLAGDWTATHWPATMESAVRSGYLAAESILQAVGRPAPLVVQDLPRGRLAALLIKDR